MASSGTADMRQNIVGTIAFGGGSVSFWACLLNDCNLAMQVFDGSSTGLRYRDDVLRNY